MGSAEGDKDTEFNKKLSLASSNSVLVESEKYKVKQAYIPNLPHDQCSGKRECEGLQCQGEAGCNDVLFLFFLLSFFLKKSYIIFHDFKIGSSSGGSHNYFMLISL